MMNVDQHNFPPTIHTNEALVSFPISIGKGDLLKFVKTDCKNHIIVDIGHPSYDYDRRNLGCYIVR